MTERSFLISGMLEIPVARQRDVGLSPSSNDIHFGIRSSEKTR